MTTIITKHGSGAPTAGQLSEGELAVDLTNKELYTKSGSTVIKIGSQGGSSGTFTDLTATSSFTSPGIDDNATSTAITINSSQNTTFAGNITSGDITIAKSGPILRVQNTNGTNQYTQLTNINGNTYFGSRSDTADGNIIIGGYGDNTFTEFARWSNLGNFVQKNNLSVQGAFTSLGIDDDATSTALTIDSSGSVLIGRTNATLGGGNGDDLQIGSGSEGAGLTIHSSTSSNGDIQFADGTNGNSSYRGLIRYQHADDQLQLWTAGARKVTIDSAGATTFYGKTSVVTAGTELNAAAHNGFGIKGSTPRLTMEPTADAQTSRIQFTNTAGTLWGSIFAYNDTALLQHSATTHTWKTLGTERMRIDSAGNLTVGDTLGPLDLITTTTTEGFGVGGSEGYVAISRSNSSAALYLNKPGESTSTVGVFIQCRQNGTSIGEIKYDGTDLAIVQTSDQRLKSNIVDSASAGSIIDAMQIRSFDWNDGVHVDYGFVAQELNQAYEPATNVGGDDVDEEPWGIKTQKLIPLLVKEIQDLRARVAQLEGA
jgi:hypothetical protein